MLSRHRPKKNTTYNGEEVIFSEALVGSGFKKDWGVEIGD
jgi:hypothetical protein